MNRLTSRTSHGAGLRMDADYQSEAEARQALMQKYIIAIDRLAAYEDCGLSPEQLGWLLDHFITPRMIAEAKMFRGADDA